MTIIEEKTTEQLIREDVARQTLEHAAIFLEGYSTNKLYHTALMLGAKLIRGLKDAR